MSKRTSDALATRSDEKREHVVVNLLGFGGYLPERVMTNEDWAAVLDTTSELITERTGIRERRFAAEDEFTLDLAEQAALGALKDAGLEPGDVDEIVVATDTPEVYLPETASLLQDRLGSRTIPTYSLRGSGSAGWIQAIDVARARVAFQQKRILVVGVELMSRLVSWDDPTTCVLFGDAAGAVILGPDGGKLTILDVISGTDGSKSGIFTRQTGGTRFPFTVDAAATADHKRIQMDENEVFHEGVRRMSSVTVEILERLGRHPSDVDLLIPHQASKPIIDALGREVRIDAERVFVNFDRYGNTGSASVPLGLWEAIEKGRVNPGDFVVLVAFGAGFHWAAAAVQF